MPEKKNEGGLEARAVRLNPLGIRVLKPPLRRQDGPIAVNWMSVAFLLVRRTARLKTLEIVVTDRALFERPAATSLPSGSLENYAHDYEAKGSGSGRRACHRRYAGHDFE